jgi:predicted glycosyltransferase
MEQDHEADAKRHEQSVRTRDTAKPDEASKTERKHIDPERLYKAIRYLKEHPEQQVRQFQLGFSTTVRRHHDPAAK